MPRLAIGKTYTFDAAHRLPAYMGKCYRQHGHTYTLHVEVEGPILSSGTSYGMVMDYADLDMLVAGAVLSLLDHRDLTSTDESDPSAVPGLALKGVYTTAENLVVWCAARLTDALNSPRRPWNDVSLRSVRLQETQSSWAEVRND